MRQRYQKWIEDWETRLTERDTNRIVRPFDWGLDWVHDWPGVNGNLPSRKADNATIERYFHELNDRIVAHSDEFFSYRTPADFRLERRVLKLCATGIDKDERNAAFNPEGKSGQFLRFTSPVATPYPENDLVNARWFPTRGRRAVIVMPQWNSDAESHNTLCRGFNLLGIAALRLSMPYHDVRMPADLSRADYAVSANVGRTISAARQGVVDVRSCLDWLEQQGYRQFGLVGTSLGSCYAFLASAHDPRVSVNVFNHVSTYFADVVWTGQSTRHIRAGIEGTTDLDRLRQAWLAVSPMAYFEKFERWAKRSVMIYGKYDMTFLPEYSRQVADEFARRRLDCKIVELPCGHYTTGEAPYKFIDGWHIMQFLRTAW
jgi:pimeloyl-ACP methyl ester carboxylesterase